MINWRPHPQYGKDFPDGIPERRWEPPKTLFFLQGIRSLQSISRILSLSRRAKCCLKPGCFQIYAEALFCALLPGVPRRLVSKRVVWQMFRCTQIASKKSFAAMLSWQKTAMILEIPWPPKPERGHIRQNRPFTKPPFCFLSILRSFYLRLCSICLSPALFRACFCIRLRLESENPRAHKNKIDASPPAKPKIPPP